MAIPPILGMALLDIKDMLEMGIQEAMAGISPMALAVGFLAAFVTGWRVLTTWLKRARWKTAQRRQRKELFRAAAAYTSYFFDEKIKILDYISKYNLI